jgi:tricorn protease
LTTGQGYYRHPTLHGESVVFVCEDDLWTVHASGGVARRLTASPAQVAFPLYSPDGRRVAFAGRDEGPTEVHVLDAEGGPPRRLTWVGCTSQPVAWRPDGSGVVFASDWREPFRVPWLHDVPLDGGPVERLPFGPARSLAREPGGPGLVLGRNTGDPARWKRYRGGTAGTLWIDRAGRGAFTPLLRLGGNLASPLWIGKRIWFLSDHEGHGNLYSVTPAGQDLRRHTDHEDFYVRFPATDGRRVVYQAGADLWLHDPATGEDRRLDVRVHGARPQRQRKFVPVGPHVESARLHPAGHSLALVARGGLFTLGAWEGAAVRHGRPSAVRLRLAAWSGDGKRLVAVTDESGEERLVVLPAAGGRAQAVEADLGRAVELAVAPAGRLRVAVTNHRQELLLVDPATGKAETIDRSEHDRIAGPAWSPDGRYLAWSVPVSRRNAAIRVLDTRGGKRHDVTDGAFKDVAPAFDPEGRYLYFVGWRTFDPVYDSHTFDLGFPRGARPYLVTLRKEEPSPFSAASRPPRGPSGEQEKPPEPSRPGAGRSGARPSAPRIVIDWTGIERRVAAFPVPEGRYVRILGARGRAVFSSVPVRGSLGEPWPASEVPPAVAVVQAWHFARQHVATIYDGATDFGLDAEGKTLLVEVGRDLRVLALPAKAEEVPDRDAPGRESGWVDLDRVRLEVDPGLEWEQMMAEAWRLQRDHFWTPDMSGVDWRAVLDRYRPLVARVATRAEFSDLLWEMQGELGTSHCYEMGGDYRSGPDWATGFLGADLGWRRGTWVVERIPEGDAWNEAARSPLRDPGLDVAEGDEVVAVGGEPVGRAHPPESRLVHAAGRPVTVTLRRRARGTSRRARTWTVTVRALASEKALRYRDWVTRNRASVHAATGGRVGYVHVPDMGAHGYAEFMRAYAPEVEREALIVDVRWNGGGHVSPLLLEKLARKRLGWDRTRWGRPLPWPDEAPAGPLVAITNEHAGSDGDIFSHGFKLLGLGPLVGKRTWGGVVGVWPRHALVDGTWTTQPEFAYWFQDVGWGIEGRGAEPDVEVEIRPQDHAKGLDPQLERAIREVLRLHRRLKPRAPDFRGRPDRRPPRLPR